MYHSTHMPKAHILPHAALAAGSSPRSPWTQDHFDLLRRQTQDSKFQSSRVMLHFLETSFLSKASCPLRIHGNVCEQVPRKKMSFLVQMFLKSLSCCKAAEHCCSHLLGLLSLHSRLALTLPFTHCSQSSASSTAPDPPSFPPLFLFNWENSQDAFILNGDKLYSTMCRVSWG